MAMQNKPKLRRPAPPPGREPQAAATPAASATADPHSVPWIIILLFGLHALLLVSILLAMTPYTNNLDDIKQSIFHGGYQFGLFKYVGLPSAPLLMVIGLAAILLKAAPLPTRWVGWALGGYWGVMIISTLVMSSGIRPEIARHMQWMGWDQVIMIWGGLGLFISAMAISAHARSSEWMIRMLTLVWMMVNIIGFCMFDVLTEGEHRSVAGWLYRSIFESKDSAVGGMIRGLVGSEGLSPLYALLLTLNNADSQMQSSILNRDFYAGISLLYLPLPMLLVLSPGERRHGVLWRCIGGATAFMTIVSIFLCQSKGEYIVFVVMMFYFVIMFFMYGGSLGLKKNHLICAILAVGAVLLTMGFLRSPNLLTNLKSLNTSIGSRSIMWRGAWEMFKDFPILGGGPGSFRVYFSTYRAPDYFLHEIANVTTYSHNYFLDMLSETGVIGLAVYLVFLSSLWLGMFQFARRHPDGHIRMLMIALTTALLGYYGSNMSSPNSRWIIGATNLYTLLGVCAGSLRRAEGWLPTVAAGQPIMRGTVAAPKIKYAVGAVAVLALPMLILSRNAGESYWDSSVRYAEGLQYMESGMSGLQRSEADKVEDSKQYLVIAAQKFEQSIIDDPTNVSAYYKIGSIYSTLDRIFESEAEMLRSSKPQEAEKLQVIADTYCDRALERYYKLEQLMPDYAEIHFNFGIVYDRMSKVRKRQAKKATQEAQEQLLAQAEEYDKSSRYHLERMHKLSVKNEVYQMLGSQYQMTGLNEDALRIYKEAVERYPEDLDMLRKYHDAALLSQSPSDMFHALDKLWWQDGLKNDYVGRMITVAVENRLARELGELANELMSINPLDPRVYYARMVLAGWMKQQADVVAEAEMYCKAGGRQVGVIQIGAKAAAELGLNDKVAELQRCIKMSTGTQATEQEALPLS